MLPCLLTFRLAHPENYSFSLSEKSFLDQSIQINILFIFERGSTEGVCGYIDQVTPSASVFSKLNKIFVGFFDEVNELFFGCFDPEIIFGEYEN